MKTQKYKRIMWLAMMLSLCCWAAPAAQNITLLLSERTMEIGIQYRWNHVDIKMGYSPDEVDYGETSLVSAYGLTEYATLSAEFMIGNERFNSFETEVRYYLVGAGIQSLIWKYDRYQVSCGGSVSSTYLVDRTGEMQDENHHGFLANAAFQASCRWRNIDITPWLGPIFHYYTFELQSGSGSGYHKNQSDHVIGGAAGVNLLIFEHFHVYGNFLYVDYAQPRIGASYRF
jgi:hypothetical protein